VQVLRFEVQTHGTGKLGVGGGDEEPSGGRKSRLQGAREGAMVTFTKIGETSVVVGGMACSVKLLSSSLKKVPIETGSC
jgi:hypothetical protein